jgi:hypothetical protein
MVESWSYAMLRETEAPPLGLRCSTPEALWSAVASRTRHRFSKIPGYRVDRIGRSCVVVFSNQKFLQQFLARGFQLIPGSEHPQPFAS